MTSHCLRPSTDKSRDYCDLYIFLLMRRNFTFRFVVWESTDLHQSSPTASCGSGYEIIMINQKFHFKRKVQRLIFKFFTVTCKVSDRPNTTGSFFSVLTASVYCFSPHGAWSTVIKSLTLESFI